MGIETIRSLRRERRFDEALVELESLLERDRECAHLWLMRGNLIQLSEATALTLEDVEKSYLTALELNPDCVEAMEDLVHFYYAVMDDKVKTQAILNRLDTKLARLEAGLRDVRFWLEDNAG
jgi:hypothetical protein